MPASLTSSLKGGPKNATGWEGPLLVQKDHTLLGFAAIGSYLTLEKPKWPSAPPS